MSTTVILELSLRPDAEGVDEIIRETLAQTAAYEGSESLEVIVDDEDPTKVLVIEKWTTTAAHDAYAAWRQTPEGANRLPSISAAPGVKRIFTESIGL